VLFGILLHVTTACGGGPRAPAPVGVPASPAPPALPSPALALPTGAQWLLFAEPQRVLTNPALRRIFDTLMPERRLTAWSERFAIDPTKVQDVAVGGYADGQLLVAHGGLDAPRIVGAADVAMDLNETTTDRPRPLTIGLIGSSRYMVAAVADDSLVVGEGAPTAWNAMFAYLNGDTAAPPEAALAHATHRSAAEDQQPSLTFHMLAPLELPLDTPIGVVLAGERQLSATMTSTDPARVDIWVALSGEFPDTIEDNLRSLVAALAAEPLGAALGLAGAMQSLRVERTAGTVTLHASLPTNRVVLGLETLFGADLWKLIDAASGH